MAMMTLTYHGIVDGVTLYMELTGQNIRVWSMTAVEIYSGLIDNLPAPILQHLIDNNIVTKKE